jgi:hypothetical protein
MRSIKKYLLFLPVFLISFSVAGQQGQRRVHEERMRAIESRRIAYFTEEMALTPSEATVFWPIYNEYLRKMEELNLQQRQWSRELDSQGQLTEAEAAKFAEREVQRFEQTALLKRTYHEKLMAVLPAQKIVQLYEAEKGFNRLLFRESQHRMRDRRNQ